VTLENNVTGYVRVKEFSDHNSIIIKFDEKLYDVTLAQLESGNIGEAFYTGSSINTYTSRNQFFYTEGNKLYQYDLVKKESTLIYEVTSGYIGDVEISAKGVLIQLGASSADFIHISTSDLNAIKVTNITLADATRSSRTGSIVGGFTHSIENVDGSRKAFFISDAGIVETIDNAEWLNIKSNTLDADSLPVLLTFGDTSTILSKWSVTTKSNELVYGVLAKETTGIRADGNTKSSSILFSTLGSVDNKKGLLYTFDATKADSLKLINNAAGFTVAF
jgi:hypothetical protein